MEKAAAEDRMLQEAIEAIRQGQRARARDLLTRLLRADSSNPEYWLWMSAVVESIKERTYCLQSVLRLDPDNEAARQGLVLVGALPAGERPISILPVFRNWETAAGTAPTRGRPAHRWSQPPWRSLSILVAALAIGGLFLLGIFGLGRGVDEVSMLPSRTPGLPPAFTPTPTLIGASQPLAATPSPTFTGPMPLWMLLEATYTPTPLAVNTPHPISEAFRAGQRAFARGDWPAALRFFKQAGQVEPSAADIPYYVGEVQARLGAFDEALAAFDQAVSIDVVFAPAYLGRARARLALGLDPEAGFENVEADFQKAIELNPGFGEAYLARAAYRLSLGELDAARADLEEVEKLLPGSPLLYLYRAQLELAQGSYPTALELSRQALDLDRTLLESYRTFGLAALGSADFSAALDALQVYLRFEAEDATAWLALGQAWTGLDRLERAHTDFENWGTIFDAGAALQAFERAAALGEQSPELSLYRGLCLLRSGNGQEAVNELLIARRAFGALPSTRKSGPLLFEINLSLGRALLAAGRPRDAAGQLDPLLQAAETDTQRAAVYYWRAQALEAAADERHAIQDWQALLALPESALAKGWAASARLHISALATPTATPTDTPAPTQTATLTRTPTLTRTATPKPSATPKVTATLEASVTSKPSPGSQTTAAAGTVTAPRLTLSPTGTAAGPPASGSNTPRPSQTPD